jgi:uncharacterized protein (DUF4415 family)
VPAPDRLFHWRYWKYGRFARRPTGARRGVLYRPVKQQITLRIDADVIEWFRSRARHGEGYQTNINRALREYIDQHQ